MNRKVLSFFMALVVTTLLVAPTKMITRAENDNSESAVSENVVSENIVRRCCLCYQSYR